MKIVVMGGTGLIGKKLVDNLGSLGHEVTASSPASGVNTLTGEGLDEALKGAAVVVDVTNSPLFKGGSALEFFEASGRNLLAAGVRAGVKHHVVLSVVGTDRLQGSDYFRAKMAQEDLVRQSGIPYTIVRSTQFFEFIGAIARSGMKGEMIRMSPAFIQPVASDDVVAAIADTVVGNPVNGIVETAGPEKFRLDELVRKYLAVIKDDREVMTDIHMSYFGVELNEDSLVPGTDPRIGTVCYEDWISEPANQLLLK
ncbi:MAG TPA: SDR family oxidoreductase [Ferruginibacter sp.]|nr:SDR family oxidoreductase [Ferruginibacter sp.]